MLWASSNRAALRSGAYVATRQQTNPLLSEVLAHSRLALVGDQTAEVLARVVRT